MYLTVRQKLKHLSKEEYISMRELSRAAKNLYNQAVYNIRLYIISGSIISKRRSIWIIRRIIPS